MNYTFKVPCPHCNTHTEIKDWVLRDSKERELIECDKCSELFVLEVEVILHLKVFAVSPRSSFKAKL